MRRLGALQVPLRVPLSSALGSLAAETGEGNPMVVPNLNFPQNRPSLASSINDSYCIIPANQTSNLMLDNYHQESQVHVSCLNVVTPIYFVNCEGLPQNKGVRPEICVTKLKHVRGVSFVDHCFSTPPVINVHSAAKASVGGWLQNFFWLVSQSVGSNLRMISILQEEYQLPFKMRLPLTRSALIIS